ncbi:hypothetical protein [uncultured Croceitalea sp.]|uniref:hypothetical protein n=1 Tax=uncultured Croceitalea sp. TaxID=1798908 RepID=UPI003306424C
MKNIIIVFTLLLATQVIAQKQLTTKEWREDLRFLQTTVHKKFPFLFKKISAQDFDAEVETFYNAIPEMEQHEVAVGFFRMIALFKYGHTRMSFSENPVPFHAIPIDFYRFPDGIYIKAAHRDYKDLVGAKVLAIAGRPIEEVVKAVYTTVPAENDMFNDAYGLDHMTIPEVLHAQGITDNLLEEIALKLEKDNKRFDYVVPANADLRVPMKYGEIRPDSDWVNGRDTTTTPYYLKHFERVYYFDYLEKDKTVYVRHSRIQNDEKEDVAVFYKRLFEFVDSNDVEKLVLDVRLNGGGNNYLNKPIITGVIANKKINQPGKFFVITGRRTFSACQNLINELDHYTNALFVGEPSSENINFYGDNRKVTLPNSKTPVYLSFAWWQDRSPWDNADYIKPHYPVQMSYQEYVTNQDPVLQSVLDFKSVNFVLNPMQYLTELYTKGEMDLVAAEAKRMANDPAYGFFDFEGEFDRVGGVLLGNDNQGALLILGTNAALFPESANAQYNYAQALRETKDFEKAKTYYNKAIAIDAESNIGKKALRILNKISEK